MLIINWLQIMLDFHSNERNNYLLYVYINGANVIRKGRANFFAREKVENIFPRNIHY